MSFSGMLSGSMRFGNPGGNRKKKHSVGKGDWDRDGITNMRDCRPMNFRKQDYIYGWQKPVKGKIIPAEKGESVRYGGRGSGHSGTGNYGYSTKKKAMKEKHVYEDEDRDLYEIEVKKPFKPDIQKAKNKTQKEYWNNADFHAALRDLKNDELDDENLKKIQDNLDAFGLEVSKEELIKAREVSDKKEINPANILLEKKGYDGIIYPEDDIMDTHYGGSVKFEEEEIDESKIIKITQPGEA